jgi:hypothetical protein
MVKLERQMLLMLNLFLTHRDEIYPLSAIICSSNCLLCMCLSNFSSSILQKQISTHRGGMQGIV